MNIHNSENQITTWNSDVFNQKLDEFTLELTESEVESFMSGHLIFITHNRTPHIIYDFIKRSIEDFESLLRKLDRQICKLVKIVNKLKIINHVFRNSYGSGRNNPRKHNLTVFLRKSSISGRKLVNGYMEDLMTFYLMLPFMICHSENQILLERIRRRHPATLKEYIRIVELETEYQNRRPIEDGLSFNYYQNIILASLMIFYELITRQPFKCIQRSKRILKEDHSTKVKIPKVLVTKIGDENRIAAQRNSIHYNNYSELRNVIMNSLNHSQSLDSYRLSETANAIRDETYRNIDIHANINADTNANTELPLRHTVRNNLSRVINLTRPHNPIPDEVVQASRNNRNHRTNILNSTTRSRSNSRSTSSRQRTKNIEEEIEARNLGSQMNHITGYGEALVMWNHFSLKETESLCNSFTWLILRQFCDECRNIDKFWNKPYFFNQCKKDRVETIERITRLMILFLTGPLFESQRMFENSPQDNSESGNRRSILTLEMENQLFNMAENTSSFKQLNIWNFNKLIRTDTAESTPVVNGNNINMDEEMTLNNRIYRDTLQDTRFIKKITSSLLTLTKIANYNGNWLGMFPHLESIKLEVFMLILLMIVLNKKIIGIISIQSNFNYFLLSVVKIWNKCVFNDDKSEISIHGVIHVDPIREKSYQECKENRVLLRIVTIILCKLSPHYTFALRLNSKVDCSLRITSFIKAATYFDAIIAFIHYSFKSQFPLKQRIINYQMITVLSNTIISCKQLNLEQSMFHISDIMNELVEFDEDHGMNDIYCQFLNVVDSQLFRQKYNRELLLYELMLNYQNLLDFIIKTKQKTVLMDDERLFNNVNYSCNIILTTVESLESHILAIYNHTDIGERRAFRFISQMQLPIDPSFNNAITYNSVKMSRYYWFELIGRIYSANTLEL